jgi:hypothetical protein
MTKAYKLILVAKWAIHGGCKRKSKSVIEREQTCTVVIAICTVATTELCICRKGLCEMAIRWGRDSAIDSRNYQHVIEARSGVMAESFFKYSHFAVIEILKQKIINHLRKEKSVVRRWTTADFVVTTGSLITEPNVWHRWCSGYWKQ